MTLTCKTYQDLITLSLSNSLSEESQKLLDLHLTTCSCCHTYLENLDCSTSKLSLPSYNPTSSPIHTLKKQNNKLQWAFLFSVICLFISLTLSYDLLDKIIFLPFIGIFGYLITHKSISLSFMTAGFLSLTGLIKDAMRASFDDLFGYLIYLALFFFLTLLGCGLGSLIKYKTKDFKHQPRFQKVQSVLLWCLLVVLCGLALNFSNQQNGNPLTACYAQFKMQHYLQETYPDLVANLNTNRYHFKANYYVSTARLYTEETTQSFSVFYKHNQVWDNYFTTYLEDKPTEYRLAQEASKEISTLLTQHSIPFLSVDCSLRAAKGQYDTIPFHKNNLESPFDVSIYRLTDTKENYVDFTAWCDTIRNLLLNEGYPLSSLSLESDPHCMPNRLSLFLDSTEVGTPITDVSSYPHFTDYGVMNDFDNDSSAEDMGYGKFDFYYNETLTHELTTLIQSLNYKNAYVKAQLNDNQELDLFIYWSGERISIDHFAEDVMLMVSALKDYGLFQTYTVMPLSFEYGWGTATEHYSYSVYDEYLHTLSLENLITMLLNEENPY